MNKIQVLTNIDGIKKAYMLALKEEALDIICLADNYEKVLGSWFDEVYSPKLYALKTQEILPDTEENRTYAKAKDQARNAVKFLDGTKSQSDVIVGSNVAVLVSYDEHEPLAVVITDKMLISGLASQFEQLWKSL